MTLQEWQQQPDIVRAQRRVRRTLLIAQVAGGIGTAAGVSMGSLIAYEVTGTESLAGISRTVGALSAGLAAPVMIAIALRFGRRRALSLGWLAALAGGLIQVLAVATRNLPLLLLGLLVFGSGQAATMQSRFAATDLELPGRRGRTLSLVVWAGAIGSVLGPNLAGPGAAVGTALGLPPISGAYLIGSVGLGVAALAISLGLRPDPLLTAHQHEQTPGAAPIKIRHVLPALWAQPSTRYAFVALGVNQTAMVTVMTLTPVHMVHHGHALTIVGFTLSLHILGMYGFSPVPGWLADRIGPPTTMAIGWAINAAALLCGVLGAASLPVVVTGLFLLGLGWSFVMVAGSALLNASTEPAQRRPAQGAVDSVTQLGAAFGAGIAGLLLAATGFAGLNLITLLFMLGVLPFALAARRAVRVGGDEGAKPAK